MTRKTLEVWVAVDADGGYGTGTDQDAACTDYDEAQGRDSVTGFRLIKVLVTVPLPEPMTATAVLEADDPPVAAIAN